MTTDKYIIDKLLSVNAVSVLLNYMKKEGHKCYVAGGAMTAIATGNHDNIADYDMYFANVDSAVAAIRYMKEENPHVAFISDKSITYVMNYDTKIQFIYYDFYPAAEDIFKHFDFSVNMMAYDNIEGKLHTHESFWMHNAQRYFTINKDTKFPLLTSLRVGKYIDKGYHTSRNQMVRLGLAIANLNITTWAEAKSQLGNSYGYTLADFKRYENTEFSMDKLFELLDTSSNSPSFENDCYLYPIDTVDFVLLNKPIEVVVINDKEYYLDKYAEDCNGLDKLIENGTLQKVVVPVGDMLSQKYYLASDKDYTLGVITSGDWVWHQIRTKAQLSNYPSYKYIYEVEFEGKDVYRYCAEYLNVHNLKPVALICRGVDVNKFKQGEEVTFKPNARMLHPEHLKREGWAFSTKRDEMLEKIAEIKRTRHYHLRKHIVIVSKNPAYARNDWSGVVVQGGEDIKADEILLYMDEFNTCFGGDITLRSDGTFSGTYYTD